MNCRARPVPPISSRASGYRARTALKPSIAVSQARSAASEPSQPTRSAAQRRPCERSARTSHGQRYAVRNNRERIGWYAQARPERSCERGVRRDDGRGTREVRGKTALDQFLRQFLIALRIVKRHDGACGEFGGKRAERDRGCGKAVRVHHVRLEALRDTAQPRDADAHADKAGRAPPRIRDAVDHKTLPLFGRGEDHDLVLVAKRGAHLRDVAVHRRAARRDEDEHLLACGA
jgi:hypothetical protein